MSTGTDPETALDDQTAAMHRQKSMCVSEWFEKEGLIPALLPMAYRKGDPIAHLDAIRSGIDALPRTAATFTATDLLGDDERFQRTFAASTHLETLFRLCGAFRCGDTSTGYRYTNPGYLHGSPHREPWGCLAERIYFARQVAPLGRVTTVDIARRFGTTPQTITGQFQTAGFEWERRRAHGLARLTRTIETVVAWTDRTYGEICGLLGTTPQSHRYHRQDKLAAEWEPPSDPTESHGFVGE